MSIESLIVRRTFPASIARLIIQRIYSTSIEKLTFQRIFSASIEGLNVQRHSQGSIEKLNVLRGSYRPKKRSSKKFCEKFSKIARTQFNPFLMCCLFFKKERFSAKGSSQANIPKTTRRVFALNGAEASKSNDLIQDTCLLYGYSLFALFDSRLTYSFISHTSMC
ncbi:hypothetical protein CR513_26625, partial [Mucuna pruriens]